MCIALVFRVQVPILDFLYSNQIFNNIFQVETFRLEMWLLAIESRSIKCKFRAFWIQYIFQIFTNKNFLENFLFFYMWELAWSGWKPGENRPLSELSSIWMLLCKCIKWTEKRFEWIKSRFSPIFYQTLYILPKH